MLGWLSEFVLLRFGRLVVDTGVWMTLVFFLYVLPVQLFGGHKLNKATLTQPSQQKENCKISIHDD